MKWSLFYFILFYFHAYINNFILIDIMIIMLVHLYCIYYDIIIIIKIINQYYL